jgi:putative transposase
MLVNQAYRYELDPNNVQGTLFAKHAGTARFAWNWALARRIERFEKNEGKARFTCAAEQHREWNEWKRTGAPWWTEVSKCAPQEAFRDLDQAFKNTTASASPEPSTSRTARWCFPGSVRSGPRSGRPSKAGSFRPV